MNAFWFPLATIVCAALNFPLAASAAESAWADTGKARVRLLADAGRAGIEMRLARNWHTYWRYPGDAGVPPRFDWSGSENLVSAEVRFPVPRRFKEAAGQVIGYEDHVIFPVRLQAANPAKPVKLRLKFDFAVCEKICIPADAALSLDVPPGGKVLPELDAAEGRVPVPGPAGNVKPLSVLAAKLERGAKPRIVVEVQTPDNLPFDLFAEGPTEDWALPLPEILETKGARTRYAIAVDGAPPGANPIPSKVRLTLASGATAIETELPLD